MVVPEREKGVRSFRLPRFVLRLSVFLLAVFSILTFIFLYNYYQVTRQIYQSKNLSLENRELREQLRLFQMKINAVSQDLSRIETFEQKLRAITGLTHQGVKSSALPLKSEPQQPLEETSDYQKFKKKHLENLQSKLQIKDSQFAIPEKSLQLADKYASFDARFQQTYRKSRQLENALHDLDSKILDKDSFLKSMPSIMPTRGWITSFFGKRLSPTKGVISMHEGLDIGAPYGEDILATADGVVISAGVKRGFGRHVHLNHGYGVETLYAHAVSLHVQPGQKVKRGELIASVGSTGSSTAPHVHYEVRVNGISVDPRLFVLEE